MQAVLTDRSSMTFSSDFNCAMLMAWLVEDRGRLHRGPRPGGGWYADMCRASWRRGRRRSTSSSFRGVRRPPHSAHHQVVRRRRFPRPGDAPALTSRSATPPCWRRRSASASSAARNAPGALRLGHLRQPDGRGRGYRDDGMIFTLLAPHGPGRRPRSTSPTEDLDRLRLYPEWRRDQRRWTGHAARRATHDALDGADVRATRAVVLPADPYCSCSAPSRALQFLSCSTSASRSVDLGRDGRQLDLDEDGGRVRA